MLLFSSLQFAIVSFRIKKIEEIKTIIFILRSYTQYQRWRLRALSVCRGFGFVVAAILYWMHCTRHIGYVCWMLYNWLRYLCVLAVLYRITAQHIHAYTRRGISTTLDETFCLLLLCLSFQPSRIRKRIYTCRWDSNSALINEQVSRKRCMPINSRMNFTCSSLIPLDKLVQRYVFSHNLLTSWTMSWSQMKVLFRYCECEVTIHDTMESTANLAHKWMHTFAVYITSRNLILH